MKFEIPYSSKNYKAYSRKRIATLVGGLVIFLIGCHILVRLSKSSKSDQTSENGQESVKIGGHYPHIGETGVSVGEKLKNEEDVILAEASKHLKQDDSSVSFFDAQGNEKGLRFLVFADCGGTDHPPYSTSAQRSVARAMNKYSTSKDISFILSLGDNFSPAGVKNLDDIRFDTTFEDAFGMPGLQKPWYIVAGNDDYKGNVTAEIAYSQLSHRWNFYRLNYMVSGKLPNEEHEIGVDIIMIDTVQLCGRLPTNGGVVPIGPDDEDQAEKTWSWIEDKLNSSHAEYLFVAGHYPVYSGGKHGSTNCLKQRLKPLLEKYRVSAYMSGHDHSLQYIEDSGVRYFVTGATNPDEDRLQHLDGVYKHTKFYWTNGLNKNIGAFMYCDVRKDSMTAEFVDSNERIIRTMHVYPRSHPVEQNLENQIIPVIRKHPQPLNSNQALNRRRN